MPFNQHGGLTLIPMPGYRPIAEKVKGKIEAMGKGKNERETPVDIVVPKFGYRASGEPFLKLKKNHVGGHDCVIITSGPGTEKMLMQLFLLLRYLVGRKASRICVVTGYFPLSRSDKDEGDDEFALPPLILDLMYASASDGRGNSLLKRVISVDLHASQLVMAAGTGVVTELSLVRRLLSLVVDEARHTRKKVVLGFPDDGSVNRTERHVAEIQRVNEMVFPIVFGSKRRSSSRKSKLGGLYGHLDQVEGSIVVCLDDEFATGGTMKNTALDLKNDYGASEVWGAVTHPVFCAESPGDILSDESPIDRIFATDTITVENRPEIQSMIEGGRLRVWSWWKDLAWAIYNHHWNETIREDR